MPQRLASRLRAANLYGVFVAGCDACPIRALHRQQGLSLVTRHSLDAVTRAHRQRAESRSSRPCTARTGRRSNARSAGGRRWQPAAAVPRNRAQRPVAASPRHRAQSAPPARTRAGPRHQRVDQPKTHPPADPTAWTCPPPPRRWPATTLLIPPDATGLVWAGTAATRRSPWPRCRSSRRPSGLGSPWTKWVSWWRRAGTATAVEPAAGRHVPPTSLPMSRPRSPISPSSARLCAALAAGSDDLTSCASTARCRSLDSRKEADRAVRRAAARVNDGSAGDVSLASLRHCAGRGTGREGQSPAVTVIKLGGVKLAASLGPVAQAPFTVLVSGHLCR